MQGSKNTFNHVAAVALLGRNLELVLDGTPAVADRASVGSLLSGCGVSFETRGDVVRISGSPARGVLPVAPGRRIRATVCYGAAVASNIGYSVTPFGGGDAFTTRPVDLHMRVLSAAGGEPRLSRGSGELLISFERPPRSFRARLAGAFGPSMGATVTALLVAARARGTSLLLDASVEPEVLATVGVLRRLGVKIERTAESSFEVTGAGEPLGGAARAAIPPDRIEAGTYLLAGLLAHGRAVLDGVTISDLAPGFVDVLRATGAELEDGAARPLLVAQLAGRPGPVVAATAPHPGLPTDLQPQLAAFLTQAEGRSVLRERVYDDRTSHVDELDKLGLRIRVSGERQDIAGPQRVLGGRVVVADIRCGAAAIVAAAACDEVVEVCDPGDHLARGYGRLVEKVERLGFDVTTTADLTGDGAARRRAQAAGLPAIAAMTSGTDSVRKK